MSFHIRSFRLRSAASLALLALSAAMLCACGGGGDTSGAGTTPAATAGMRSAKALAAAAAEPAKPGVAEATFSSFEAAHVHPLDITPDGKRLLSVNTANSTLEIFDVSGASVTPSKVVKVGMDPVTVRAASNNEAWVVNVLSDSVSIVDLSNGTVKATLATDDEPADVVFAGTPRRAYVSCAQARNLMIFDAQAPTSALARIPILGQQPRALAASADGSKVYLAIFESGNGTIALTAKDSFFEPNIVRDPTGPYGGINPPPNANNATTFNPPLNPANPAPPSGVSLIVRRTAAGDWVDDNGRNWKPWVNGSKTSGSTAYKRVQGWDLIDRDVAIIDTATQAVSYQGGMLNIVMALAVNPASGRIAVVGTDATNQIRYEPVIAGTFLRVLFGGFVPGQANTVADLNSHLTYKTSSVAVSERNKSIGDPRGIVWNAAGTKAYVTGMGSNNLIVLNASGSRAGINPTINVGQGPTGIVLQESQKRAFVLNRFDATISVIDLNTERVSGTVALSYDPTPQVVKDGRPMLYDTHRFSGLGHISCASCHVDGKTDRLAWDLGNPAGAMVTATDAAGTTVQHHPMKGPLLTQTLVDTMQSAFLHWRGDRPDLAHFSAAFQTLQGADAPATAGEIAAMQSFLQTLRTPPNPYRNIDNSYSSAVQMPGPRGGVLRVGNAALGAGEFESGCRGCHLGHNGRGNVFLDRPAFSGGGIFLNPPKWQNFYRRDGLWFGDATGSTAGFGYQQDGTYDSTHNNSRSDNLMAFMYSFNGSFPYTPAGLSANTVAVDSHAAVGKQVTLSASVVADPLLTQLIALADSKAIGLVASGCVGGERRGYAYTGANVFQADRVGETPSLAALKVTAVAGSPITFTAVRAGTQTRIGIDQDGDGVLDGAQGITPARACVSGTVTSLLVNGGFDNNTVAAGGWAQLSSLAGWQGSAGVVEVWRNLLGWSGVDGDSWIELDAGNAVDAVSQTVKTNPGDKLVLRFWYSARPGVASTSNQFNVLWNGTVIDTLAPDGTALSAPAWQTKAYVVTATGNDTLAFAESGTNDGFGGLIDAVTLVSQGASPAVNLAAGKTATQSSTAFGGDASRAVDGNTDGNFFNNSVTHTAGGTQDWWQVDLGASKAIQSVNLYNRTDCCNTRLANFYVLTSPTDMTGKTLAQLQADSTVAKQYVATDSALIAVPFGGASGRYVRVQMAGTQYLSLAEVQVMGN